MSERTLLATKPAARSIVLRSLPTLFWTLLLAASAQWIANATATPALSLWAWRAAGTIILLRVIWEVLVWLCRAYTLTDERVVAATGVLERRVVDVPHGRIQHVLVHRSIGERIFGLGTIGVTTAGTGVIDLFWIMVARPMDRLQTLRDATRGTSPPAPVIGIAGGIGSGKSRVAKEFADLGCLVIDSDREARAALEREEVKRQLVAWWGDGVLDESGAVARSKVAEIVFSDPEQRKRLEALIHPLVKRSRDELVAASPGHRAVVIDAPLLFEAGLDADCDAVVFVDAPRNTRLARVREHRGWSEEELDRREASQLPIAEKRRRSDHVITNAGGLGELAGQARRVLEAIEQGRQRRPTGERGNSLGSASSVE